MNASPDSGGQERTSAPVTVEAVLAAAADHLDSIASTGSVTDAFGITYTGQPAYLIEHVLVRRDLTPDLPRLAFNAAHYLERWVTCGELDAEHVAAFGALTARQVCEIVAYVANLPHPPALWGPGPTTINTWMALLLSDAIDSEDSLDLDDFRDQSGDQLTAARTLDIDVSTCDGRDTVTMEFAGRGHEEIQWRVPPTAIDLPLADALAVLRYGYDPADVEATVAPHAHNQLRSPSRDLGPRVKVIDGPDYTLHLCGPDRRPATAPRAETEPTDTASTQFRAADMAGKVAFQSGRGTTLLLWAHAVLAPPAEFDTFRQHYTNHLAATAHDGVAEGSNAALCIVMRTMQELLPLTPGQYHPDTTSVALLGELSSLTPLSPNATRYAELLLDKCDPVTFRGRFLTILDETRDNDAVFEAAVAIGRRMVTRHNITGQPWSAYQILGDAIAGQWRWE